jgi:hypothetical protein
MMLVTFAFEVGRRLVEWAVPTAYVAVMPPQQTLEQALASLKKKKADTPESETPSGGYH